MRASRVACVSGVRKAVYSISPLMSPVTRSPSSSSSSTATRVIVICLAVTSQVTITFCSVQDLSHARFVFFIVPPSWSICRAPPPLRWQIETIIFGRGLDMVAVVVVGVRSAIDDEICNFECLHPACRRVYNLL